MDFFERPKSTWRGHFFSSSFMEKFFSCFPNLQSEIQNSFQNFPLTKDQIKLSFGVGTCLYCPLIEPSSPYLMLYNKVLHHMHIFFKLLWTNLAQARSSISKYLFFKKLRGGGGEGARGSPLFWLDLKPYFNQSKRGTYNLLHFILSTPNLVRKR